MHLQYLYFPPLLPQHLAIFAIWPSQSTTLYFYSDHHRGQVCRSGCPRRIPKEFRSKGCFKLLVSPCVVPRGFPLAVRAGSACPETKRCDSKTPCFPPSPLIHSNEKTRFERCRDPSSEYKHTRTTPQILIVQGHSEPVKSQSRWIPHSRPFRLSYAPAVRRRGPAVLPTRRQRRSRRP